MTAAPTAYLIGVPILARKKISKMLAAAGQDVLMGSDVGTVSSHHREIAKILVSEKLKPNDTRWSRVQWPAYEALGPVTVSDQINAAHVLKQRETSSSVPVVLGRCETVLNLAACRCHFYHKIHTRRTTQINAATPTGLILPPVCVTSELREEVFAHVVRCALVRIRN